MFVAAIAVFVLGSIGCALSSSAHRISCIARIAAGHGRRDDDAGRPPGAACARSTERELVNAMAWVTMPALIGPVIGPPLGGFITTYFSWHWIFLINVPIGPARHLPGDALHRSRSAAEDPERFDVCGHDAGRDRGLRGMAFGLSVAGLDTCCPGLSWRG